MTMLRLLFAMELNGVHVQYEFLCLQIVCVSLHRGSVKHAEEIFIA